MPNQRANIHIQSYTPTWKIEFEQIAAIIREAVGQKIVDLQHVGSTAVPGLAAKPIIDIMLGVGDFPDDGNAVRDQLEKIEFEYVRTVDDARMIFRKGEWGNGTHHLHLVEHNGSEWQRVIKFRDLLRNDSAAVRRYAHIKRALAEKFGNDRPSYTRAKSEFITRLLGES